MKNTDNKTLNIIGQQPTQSFEPEQLKTQDQLTDDGSTPKLQKPVEAKGAPVPKPSKKMVQVLDLSEEHKSEYDHQKTGQSSPSRKVPEP